MNLEALTAGSVRFCRNNTGEFTPGVDNHWGETITDGTLVYRLVSAEFGVL